MCGVCLAAQALADVQRLNYTLRHLRPHICFLPRMSIMNSLSSDLPAKKPYAAPVLTMHGDLRSLTQAGSAGTKENGKCKAGSAKCAKP